jgi:hypothetical protein
MPQCIGIVYRPPRSSYRPRVQGLGVILLEECAGRQRAGGHAITGSSAESQHGGHQWAIVACYLGIWKVQYRLTGNNTITTQWIKIQHVDMQNVMLI